MAFEKAKSCDKPAVSLGYNHVLVSFSGVTETEGDPNTHQNKGDPIGLNERFRWLSDMSSAQIAQMLGCSVRHWRDGTRPVTEEWKDRIMLMREALVSLGTGQNGQNGTE